MVKLIFNGTISVIGAVGSLFSNVKYPDFRPIKPTKNQDLDNMQSDWMKIGGDLSKVILREKSVEQDSNH